MGDVTVWLASSPTTAKSIGVLPGVSTVVADSHGLWFGTGAGIYLYTQADGMKKILSQHAYVAGGCV